MDEATNNPVPEIFYDDIGKEDQVVVFLHGFLESSKIWNEYADKLSSKYRVILIDLPGHGKSSVVNDVHSMDMMAEEVRNILEINGINKCVLIGHSMGGYATMAFAKRFKHFLRGMVLFHSHAAADTEEQKKNRELTIRAVENNHLDFISSFTPSLFAPENREKYSSEIEWLKKMGKNMPVKGIVAALKGMRERDDHVGTLKKVNRPVLIIGGDKDERIPVMKLKEQAMGEHIRLKIMENTGHMGFIEAKGECFKEIRDFIQNCYKK